MPYVIRDENGAIAKASTRAIPGAELLPHGDPALLNFIQARGVDPAVIEVALNELRRTDSDMARVVEDLITALLRKNVLKMTDFPKAVQDRVALRVRLRSQIAEAYDRATANKAP